MPRTIVLSLLLALLLTCCTSAPPATSTEIFEIDPTLTKAAKIDTTMTETPQEASEIPTIPFPSHVPTIIVTREPEVGIMGEDEAIQSAKETLSEALDVDTDQIEVVYVTKIDWPDASLGCPEKGMFYAQVIIPGYKVILKADEDQYDVHVGEGRAVICVSGQPMGKTLPDLDISDAVLMGKLARKDLAEHLGVAEEDIKVNWIKPKTWADASLGCPEPGEDYAQVETEGYQIELEHEGEAYTYYSDTNHVTLCNLP